VTFLANADAADWFCAHAFIILTSRADNVQARMASANRSVVAHAAAQRAGGLTHDNAVFVLNAGSSSLKFSVYGLADQDLNLVAHGEIEGLGASAHFKANDERGRTLADVSLGDPTRSFGHAEAFAHLAHWAYEHFADELVPLAVGHRGSRGAPSANRR
jgi:hypothetical protein